MIRNRNHGLLEQIVALLDQIVVEMKAIMVAQVIPDHLLSKCGQRIPVVIEQGSYNNRTTILQRWPVVNLQNQQRVNNKYLNNH